MTGVQTCALPISRSAGNVPDGLGAFANREEAIGAFVPAFMGAKVGFAAGDRAGGRGPDGYCLRADERLGPWGLGSAKPFGPYEKKPGSGAGGLSVQRRQAALVL